MRPDGTREIKTIDFNGRTQVTVDHVNPPGPHDIVHTEVSLSNGVRTEFEQRADGNVESRNINDSHPHEGGGEPHGEHGGNGGGSADREPHAHEPHEGHI
ncbi:hypothetical protein [Mucilaginibacter sp. BT774]|uniref:hypothetical protein n=1 Tax=Mucilaginibacter sp. BT774 TaxID=3062276 RepID=UPI0026762AE0|nr:hypothetical protein [Mucilaginibacter sp. BT774]MDO3627656.1 hypothetical protein [Mucilaginibacter sp. BT774]